MVTHSGPPPERLPGGVGLSVPQRALLPLTTKSAPVVSSRNECPAGVSWCDPHMQLFVVLRGTRSKATLGRHSHKAFCMRAERARERPLKLGH